MILPAAKVMRRLPITRKARIAFREHIIEKRGCKKTAEKKKRVTSEKMKLAFLRKKMWKTSKMAKMRTTIKAVAEIDQKRLRNMWITCFFRRRLKL